MPERYELTLAPDLDRATFDGRACVVVDVRTEVREIVLNAVDLDIRSAALVSGELSLRAEIRLDPEHERAVLALDGAAPPGRWVLDLDFAGVLNDRLVGFYRSTYTDDDGETHVIATTQFESTDARRAFPCWDEPDLKAVFAVTLIVDEGLLAVSNASVRSDEPDPERPGKRRVAFADTMPMSTYLVAFIVGPLEATAPVDVAGTPLRIVHVPGRRHLTGFALDAGRHALEFFASYFDIPYPGEKLDLIALPDFAFGAMENLGAVTFRETALLVRPDGSRAELERVADVVAHEVAHMWFGDLVTMKWWNGIWLNEAFATFMELLAVDAFRPEWDRWVSFGRGRAVAMVIDGMASTRPIEFPVVAPNEAEGMFDVLTYQKGASVVRMLERYLGPERFRDGIRLYMGRHAYGNTETTDLWDALEEATGEPVRSTMDSWIFQGGYPVLSIDADVSGSSVTISQRRFRYRPDPEDDRVLWKVPVLMRASVNGEHRELSLLLDGPSTHLDLGGRLDWIVVNARGEGFYRVRYASDLLRRLTAPAALGQLGPIERFALVTDSWAAVWSGLAPVDDYVELVRLFGGERDPVVWSAILAPFTLFERCLPEERREGLRRFVAELAGPAFERVGWQARPGEDDKEPRLRATLLTALGTIADDPEVRRRAFELHEAFLTDASAVDADIVPSLVEIVAKHGGEAEFTTLLERHRNPQTPQEEVRYLLALPAFRHERLVRRALEMALHDVRTQNAPDLVNAALGNRWHGHLAWEWVKEHWTMLLDRFPDNAHARMLGGIATLDDPMTAQDVAAFLASHPIESGQRTVDQTLERLWVNVAFRERAAERLAKLFA